MLCVVCACVCVWLCACVCVCVHGCVCIHAFVFCCLHHMLLLKVWQFGQDVAAQFIRYLIFGF